MKGHCNASCVCSSISNAKVRCVSCFDFIAAIAKREDLPSVASGLAAVAYVVSERDVNCLPEVGGDNLVCEALAHDLLQVAGIEGCRVEDNRVGCCVDCCDLSWRWRSEGGPEANEREGLPKVVAGWFHVVERSLDVERVGVADGLLDDFRHTRALLSWG